MTIGRRRRSATQPRPGEEVVLDSNLEADGSDFFALGGVDISADGTLAAWASDVTGDERYTVRVRTIATGVDSTVDRIERTAGHPVFSPDARDLYYCTVDDSWRPDTVWRHRVGTPPTDDVTVFTEPDERYWVGVGRTRSRRYLVISVGSKITSEVHLLDTAVPDARVPGGLAEGRRRRVRRGARRRGGTRPTPHHPQRRGGELRTGGGRRGGPARRANRCHPALAGEQAGRCGCLRRPSRRVVPTRCAHPVGHHPPERLDRSGPARRLRRAARDRVRRAPLRRRTGQHPGMGLTRRADRLFLLRDADDGARSHARHRGR